MRNEIHIFAGHFGSGKTEVALNYALRLRSEGKQVTLVDMDTVNPYFRSSDAGELLKKNNIELIANDFAGSNVDMPTVPCELLRVFEENGKAVIFDIGGDDDGAYAMGQYSGKILKNGYRMHLVVNIKRPLSKKAEDILETAGRIEYASRLKFTDIINNTNLSLQSDEDTLVSGIDEVKRLSEMMNIPVWMHTGLEKSLLKVPKGMETMKLERHLRLPWE